MSEERQKEIYEDENVIHILHHKEVYFDPMFPSRYVKSDEISGKLYSEHEPVVSIIETGIQNDSPTNRRVLSPTENISKGTEGRPIRNQHRNQHRTSDSKENSANSTGLNESDVNKESMEIDISTIGTDNSIPVKHEVLSPTSGLDTVQDCLTVSGNHYFKYLLSVIEGYAKHSKEVQDSFNPFPKHTGQLTPQIKLKKAVYLTNNMRTYINKACCYDAMNDVVDLLITCRLNDAHRIENKNKYHILCAFFKQERKSGVGVQVYSNLNYIINNAYKQNKDGSYEQVAQLVIFLGMNIDSKNHAVCLEINLLEKKAYIYDSSLDNIAYSTPELWKYLNKKCFLKEVLFNKPHPIGQQRGSNCINMTIEAIVHLLGGSSIRNQVQIAKEHLEISKSALMNNIVSVLKYIENKEYTQACDLLNEIKKQCSIYWGGPLFLLEAYLCWQTKQGNTYDILFTLIKANATSVSNYQYLTCLDALMLDIEGGMLNGLDYINKRENRQIGALYEEKINACTMQILILLAEAFLKKHCYAHVSAFLDKYKKAYEKVHTGNDHNAQFLEMKYNINLHGYSSAYDICLNLNVDKVYTTYKNELENFISKLIKGLTSISEHSKVMDLFMGKMRPYIKEDDYIYKEIALVILHKKRTNTSYDSHFTTLPYRNIDILTVEECMAENMSIPNATQLHYIYAHCTQL